MASNSARNMAEELNSTPPQFESVAGLMAEMSLESNDATPLTTGAADLETSGTTSTLTTTFQPLDDFPQFSEFAPEIQVMIYKLMIPRGMVMEVTWEDSVKQFVAKTMIAVLGICRASREEALKVLTPVYPSDHWPDRDHWRPIYFNRAIDILIVRDTGILWRNSWQINRITGPLRFHGPFQTPSDEELEETRQRIQDMGYTKHVKVTAHWHRFKSPVHFWTLA